MLIRLKKYDYYFIIVLLCNISILIYVIGKLSISAKEANLFFDNKLPIAKLANITAYYFGINDYAIRIPNIIFNSLNLILIYLISKKILKRPYDSVICAVIYTLIPGVILQNALLNQSSITLFLALLICYMEIIKKRIIYSLFVVAIFLDSTAFMLFISLFFYALYHKKKKEMLFATICFFINIYIYGIDVSGRPSGRFLNVVWELSLLYSPLLFIYYIYTLYRNATKENKSFLLFVSLSSLVVSVIFSIRQEIDKEIFLFMNLCGIPLVVKQCLSDIRIRLPEFRNHYKNRFIIILMVLVTEAFALIFSKSLYFFTKNNYDNFFLDSFYIAKELSIELKKRNIKSVIIEDEGMQKRLMFYGIKKGGAKLKKSKKWGNIEIKYHNAVMARYII